VSGLVSVVFVYKSFLKMVAPLLNCTAVEQQAVTYFFGGLKLLKKMFARYDEHWVQEGSVAPQ